MMRKAKSDYFRLKIDASKATDPKAGWKLINSLTGRGNKSSPVNDILVNDKIVSDDKDISESFNDFFVNIGPTDISGPLIDCLNHSALLEELSISQRQGIISLIPKKNKDPLLLKNWRPVTF